MVLEEMAYYQQAIKDVELDSFGNASERGVGAAVYTVVRQLAGNAQKMVVVTSSLAKQ